MRLFSVISALMNLSSSNSAGDSEPPVKIIVAVARNRVIGRDGRLPWSIPEDWQHFLDSTEGGTLVAGRRCVDELVDTGALADGRRRVFKVSTTQKGPDCFSDFPSALEAAKECGRPVWICGGERIYGEAMPIADELVLTLVDVDFEGDTYFPPWKDEFPCLLSERKSQHGEIPLYFRVYRRDGVKEAPKCV